MWRCHYKAAPTPKLFKDPECWPSRGLNCANRSAVTMYNDELMPFPGLAVSEFAMLIRLYLSRFGTAVSSNKDNT